MKIELFSKKYKVRLLTNEDIDAIYDLCCKNVIYYEYCPPFISRQLILDDMKVLPQGKTAEDKYYIGFYEKEKLLAVMDFIDNHPQKGIAYIGFFMTDISIQNNGLGTDIIHELCQYLMDLGYDAVQLVWVKGNPQSEHFWLKNHFTPLMETKSNVSDHVILAERLLKVKA